MLRVGIIGIGNTGNQVAALAKEKLAIPVIAINSSEKDLETVPAGVTKKLISDKEGLTQGAGKDRKLAKKYLKDSILKITKDEDIINMVKGLDVLFVISSTGGGTGSGTAPLFSSIMSEEFRKVKVILIGVTPVDNEALSSHVNSLEYLNELYNVLENPTYLLYDNDRYADLSSYKAIETVNNEIVEDINVLRCYFNTSTKYDSIDDKDITRLISFGGGILVIRLEDFKEKECETQTIEQMIIEKIKRNAHVEIQRDKNVMASGIIANLSETLIDQFNDNIPEVKEFVGEPIHSFKHTHVNEDRKESNNVFLILSGLSPVNDKITKITDRIEEIEEKQKTLKEENAINASELKSLSDKIADRKNEDTDEDDSSLNLTGIFNKFDI